MNELRIKAHPDGIMPAPEAKGIMLDHKALIERATDAYRLRCRRMGLEPQQPCCARSDAEEDGGAIMVVLRNVNGTLATYQYDPERDRLRWLAPEIPPKTKADPRSRVNIAESAKCAAHRDVRAKWGQCYANACRIIWYVPGYECADYVEGLSVFPNGLLIEHGWVERDGEIIDPLHSRFEGVAYFPGLRYQGGAGIAKAMALPKPEYAEELPIFSRFGLGGSNSPEFSQARLDAMEYLKRLPAGSLHSGSNTF